MITRKSEDAKEFLDLVTSAGGVGIALPTIDIVPNLSAIKNAVRLILFRRLRYLYFYESKWRGSAL